MITYFVVIAQLALFSCALALPQVTVHGEASWTQVPFAIRLLESVAAFDESLYESALRSIFATGGSDIDFNHDYDENDDDADDVNNVLKDSIVYDRFFAQHNNLSHIAKSVIDFHLTYNMFGPRIGAHYAYYVSKKYSTSIALKCTTDSFGTTMSDHNSWVQFKNQIYCSNEDLFAFKTESQAENVLETFDRVIGKLGPIVVFYGEPSSKQFLPMLDSLLTDSKNGKLRFVFRYIPDETASRDHLRGYSVDFTINNMRNTKKDSDEDFPLGDIRNIDCSLLRYPSNVKDIGLKLTSYILNQDISELEKFEALKTISQSLPCYMASLDKSPVSEAVKAALTSNEKKGITSNTNGFYINGSPINKLELNVFNAFEKVKSELVIVQSLQALGLTTIQAKYLINKFALVSAVNDYKYRSGKSLWGSNTNRFKVYEQRFNPKGKSDGGVIFFNNIEEDQTYEKYSRNADEIYLGPQGMNIRMGQIPPLRENVHDLIFVINLHDKEQLRVLFSFAKVILDQGLVHQLGILPLKGSDPLDEFMARKLYSILMVSDTTEALGFLYAYFATMEPEEEQKLFDSIEDNIDDLDELFATANQFSIKEPSIIFSGVIHSLYERDWQLSMAQQILHDVKTLQEAMMEGKHENRTLKSILYDDAKSERNLKINPANPSDIKYKLITDELVSKSLPIRFAGNQTYLPTTVWLIGDFGSEIILEQLILLLSVMKEADFNFQLRLVNTRTNTQVFDMISSITEITEEKIDHIIEWVDTIRNDIPVYRYAKTQDLFKVFEDCDLSIDKNTLLVNSRVLDLDEVFSEKNIRSLLEFENSYRLSTFDRIIEEKSNIFNDKNSSVEFIESIGGDSFDFFDMLSSIVTNSFYLSKDILSTDVSRYDFDILDMLNSITVVDNDSDEKEIDLLLILDPLDEYSQDMLTIANAFVDFQFVQVRILIQPSTDKQVSRFHSGNMPRSKPTFGLEGDFITESVPSSLVLPLNESFTLNLRAPFSWVTEIKNVSKDFDSANFTLSGLNVEPKLTFGLKKLVLEGYASYVDYGSYPSGLILSLSNNTYSTDATVLSTLGYFQFSVSPGSWRLGINSKFNSVGYSLLNDIKGYETSNEYIVSSYPVSVYSLAGLKIYPKFTTGKAIAVDEDSKNPVKGWSVKLLLNKLTFKKEPEVNVFTVISGPTYERLSKTMILSVIKNSKYSVKFWILEKYISPQFRSDLAILAKKYGFEYEFIGYQWPVWLRAQDLHHREVWAYKILFLDVLFPMNLSRVIYIDADLTVRSDLKELIDFDLEGAPYGFTPMCEDRDEMSQYRFWKSGYWDKVLGDDFKYHISAMFVVDLEVFRKLYVGHYLRSSYQKLSSDPNSLANLDQDLPNNLQHRVPIYSLPAKWLWCETWCSGSTKEEASIIDMCNNPANLEPKSKAIERIVPEWTLLEKEVNGTLQEAFESACHDEL